MTNWKTYTIKSRNIDRGIPHVVWFQLNLYVKYSDCPWDIVFCVNEPPFSNWQVGENIEIDNDRTCYEKFGHRFNDTSIVRKVGSSSEVTRGQAIADRLIREVNSQPPGKVEFEHRIEHRDSSPERFIYRRNY